MWFLAIMAFASLFLLAMLSVHGLFGLFLPTPFPNQSPALRARKSSNAMPVPSFDLDAFTKDKSPTLQPPPSGKKKSKKRGRAMPAPQMGGMPDFNHPMMQSMLSNPDMMLNMLPPGPDKDRMKTMLGNPMFRSMLGNPEMLKMAASMGPPPPLASSFINKGTKDD